MHEQLTYLLHTTIPLFDNNPADLAEVNNKQSAKEWRTLDIIYTLDEKADKKSFYAVLISLIKRGKNPKTIS